MPSLTAAACYSISLHFFQRPWAPLLQAITGYVDTDLAAAQAVICNSQSWTKAPHLRCNWSKRLTEQQVRGFEPQWRRAADVVEAPSPCLKLP